MVRRRTTGAFDDETCDMLSAFASQSAVALTNARLYQQLELQSRELATTSQHKSDFLASMSHELRTPLNAVIGFSEVLLERMFGDLNERQAEYVQDILDAGRHLLALLNDVLDLSKVEAGRMELEVTTFPAGDAIQSVLALVRERAVQLGVELRFDAADAPTHITADELRFKQVLLNLIGNAVKFTREGGTVTVRAWTGGPEVLITVADTGIGIAASDRSRIFDSFQQGTRSASSSEGTGLGLTLTRRIVELHGGRMWLESEVGLGSTFGLALPRRVQPGVPDPGWHEPAVEDARRAVVVIEDDPSSAELVAVHLAAAGLRPVNVGTGEEGLAAITALRPAAVVLDIHLPGMDGWDVLGAIKADPRIASTPVVVVSVLPGARSRLRARGVGLPREARVQGGAARGGVACGRRARRPGGRPPRRRRHRRRRHGARPHPRHLGAAGLDRGDVLGRRGGALRRPLDAAVRGPRRPADAGRRRVRGHRRPAGGPADGGDPRRRAHGEEPHAR